MISAKDPMILQLTLKWTILVGTLSVWAVSKLRDSLKKKKCSVHLINKFLTRIFKKFFMTSTSWITSRMSKPKTVEYFAEITKSKMFNSTAKSMRLYIVEFVFGPMVITSLASDTALRKKLLNTAECFLRRCLL